MPTQQSAISSLAPMPPSVMDFNRRTPDRLPAQIYRSIPVLLVDDESSVRKALRKTLEAWGCRVSEAINGQDAIDQLRQNPRQLVLSDIDMPEMDGLDLLLYLENEFPDSGIIMVTGMSHERLIDEALAREFARLFVLTSDLHHVETGTHIRRIGRLSKLLADLAGCPAHFSNLIGDAAVLHDIGKLAIPDAILKKPGPLTPEEFDIMKTHPVLGGQILASAKDPFLKMAHTVALYHHERWDGKGYPNGLVGEDCPLEARIVGVVDVYDALTERRVYKEPWPVERVQNFFAEKSKNMFDPELVNLLLTHYDAFEAERLADSQAEIL